MKFPEIKFDGLPAGERIKWRTRLSRLIGSLSPRERGIVPPIFVYTTLSKALYQTFNPDSPYIDELAADFFSPKKVIWGFSYLNDDKVRNQKISKDDFQRIVLAIQKREDKPEMLTPEFIILHEIGHFYIEKVEKIKTCNHNAKAVEYMADQFAVRSYLRLHHKHPDYVTFSNKQKQIKWEQGMVRAFARHSSGLERLDFNKIANEMMEEVQWQSLYQK